MFCKVILSLKVSLTRKALDLYLNLGSKYQIKSLNFIAHVGRNFLNAIVVCHLKGDNSESLDPVILMRLLGLAHQTRAAAERNNSVDHDIFWFSAFIPECERWEYN